MLSIENIIQTIIFIVCVITLIRYIFILKKIEDKIKQNKGGNDNAIR